MFHNLKKQKDSKVATNLKNGDSDRQLSLFNINRKKEFVRLDYHLNEAIKLQKKNDNCKFMPDTPRWTSLRQGVHIWLVYKTKDKRLKRTD